MPRLSPRARQKIIRLWKDGTSASKVMRILSDDGLKISKSTVLNTVKRWKTHGTVMDLKRQTVKSKVQGEHIEYMDRLIEANREITSPRLLQEVEAKFGLNLHLSTVRRYRKNVLEWVCTKPKYCQMIRTANVAKRLAYVEERLACRDKFENAIFTDESSIELEHTARIQFRRKSEPAVMVGKPKHPLKVHVWAGISHRGPTDIIIFTGIMNADFYVKVLERGLLPFVAEAFPDTDYRFIQDNDPKHTSKVAKAFYQKENIKWWPTPAESPDLNPIELVWHELKHNIRTVYKPRNQDQLVEAIETFWSEKMTVEKCKKYIGHLQTVMPIVKEKQGKASGH
ncbi:Transposable element Tcb2 transposase [Holothuria leucospilota]|uniref:Transposable element Tcb2 transposase n=1 Tax=Holothuria leucospilota TaxID=206669 RepID=A0A9Q1BAK8_HOLLE|nr:Transposable element Tcb2 transposase [Holothuria leucospilota]